MKVLKLLLLIVFLLSGCGTLSQFTYDGAGNFNNLMSYRNENYSYNDNVNEYDFDSILLVHVKIIDHSPKPEQYSFPIAMFRVPEEYFNSSPELKDTLYWRGDFARYYHHRIYGDWTQNNGINKLDNLAILGIKSKIKKVILTKIRLQFFAASAWLDVPINKTFRINPGSINYLGTLLIEVANTGKSSGRTIKRAYFQYDTAIVEGNIYNTQWKLSFEESDLGDVILGENQRLTFVFPEDALLVEVIPLPEGRERGDLSKIKELSWENTVLARFDIVFEIEETLDKEVLQFFMDLRESITGIVSGPEGPAVIILAIILVGAYLHLQGKVKRVVK